jgi:hypothetical protein
VTWSSWSVGTKSRSRAGRACSGVLEDEVLAGGALHGALDHLDELADAVLLVDDEVAGRSCERVDLVAALATASAACPWSSPGHRRGAR